MLSRVADSLYWMSRYLERAEYTSRVMGVHLNLMLEHDLGSSGTRWSRVVSALGSHDKEDGEDFTAAETYGLAQIVTSIGAARENARQVREQISSEMWEEINRLFHESKRIGTPERFRAQPFDLVNRAHESAHLFHGITDSTMLHGEGWQFIQAGRFIERVQHTARLIDRHFAEFYRRGLDPVSAAEHMEWVGLLRSCTAFEAYCKVYTADLRPERVAEFLLLKRRVSAFGALRRGAVWGAPLDSIHNATARKSDRLAKQAGRLAAALSYTPLEEIMSNLHEFSASIRRLCGHIHGGIHQVYISYPIEAAIGA